MACNKPATPTTATTGDGSAEGTKSEEGGESIVEPTMIGGAFLVCAKDESMQQKDNHVAAGCRVEDKDKMPYKLPSGITSSLEVYDPFNSPISSSLVQRNEAGGTWDWRVYVPMEIAWTNESLVKFVKNSDAVGSASTEINLAQAGASEYASVTLGAIHDYALGDGAASCSLEAGNDRVSIGDTMVVPFYYSYPSAGSKVAITIKDLCFTEASNQNLSVTLLKGAATKFSQSVTATSNSVLVPGVTLESGIYHLVLKATSGGALFPKIKFIVQNSDFLQLGIPVKSISSAPVDGGVTPSSFDKEDSANIFATSTIN